jgi:hypothetical protein
VTANEYRAKAKEVFDKSKQEHNPAMKAQLELIALAYLDMAEQVGARLPFLKFKTVITRSPSRLFGTSDWLRAVTTSVFEPSVNSENVDGGEGALQRK